MSHDLPEEINLKAKVVQGAEMIPGLVKGGPDVVELELKYNFQDYNGTWKIKDLDSVHKTISTDRFIFCNRNHGKKVTYSLSTVFDVLKIEEEPISSIFDTCPDRVIPSITTKPNILQITLFQRTCSKFIKVYHGHNFF